MVDVDNRVQLAPGQFAADGLAQNVPLATGLLVGDFVAINAKGQRLPVEFPEEGGGRAHVAARSDGARIQG